MFRNWGLVPVAGARHKRLLQSGILCFALCTAVSSGFAQEPQPGTPQAPAASSVPGASSAQQAPSASPAPAAPGPETAGPAPAAVSPGAPAADALPSDLLPRDLSPWGMFVAADNLVKAVMIGLAFASVLTWTIALAK